MLLGHDNHFRYYSADDDDDAVQHADLASSSTPTSAGSSPHTHTSSPTIIIALLMDEGISYCRFIHIDNVA